MFKPLRTEVLDGDPRRIKLTYTCLICQQPNEITVEHAKWLRYRSGAFVQDVWPELSPADRETLISGSHDACFDKAFPEED